MLVFLLKRISQVVPVVIGVSILVFSMLHLIPGDPARMMVGIDAPKEVIEQAREELGLNEPLLKQFGIFIGHAITGDLGTSIRTGLPVSEEIANRLPITLTIAVGATLFATVFGMLCGIIAAVKQNKLGDNLIMIVSLASVSTPSYFLGLLLMMIFSVYLGWLPTIGIASPVHYVLPIITLGAQSMGLIARMTRSGMLDVLRQDYIRTARAKGLPNRIIIYMHALKNALIPVVTVVGLRFGGLLAGTVLVESVFAVPGVGRFMVDSVLNRDYPAVQGTVLVLAIIFVLINLLVDIVYRVIDPRITITEG
ncbi:ABC transporter permease [Paenibacillus sp. HN-1]|uniref:ABC transporter permease n=1 Tax=Paenibacillus TaxID=44249 RepID=UPI001CA8E822|nr:MULTISPECIES: ABC transporter permease [Paenibacillus]MBY9078491.1 ABC transporter permease [Paenibacillus sp. CGMCC 1.18879]MBY9082784.1 ABC transporter permease [Paenibacillus sinensis]